MICIRTGYTIGTGCIYTGVVAVLKALGVSGYPSIVFGSLR